MPGTPKDALSELTSAWGVADTTTYDAVVAQLSRALSDKGLDMIEASMRRNRAILTVPAHQGHLAELLTDDLAQIAHDASSGRITSVRITIAYPYAPPTRKAQHEH